MDASAKGPYIFVLSFESPRSCSLECSMGALGPSESRPETVADIDAMKAPREISRKLQAKL